MSELRGFSSQNVSAEQLVSPDQDPAQSALLLQGCSCWMSQRVLVKQRGFLSPLTPVANTNGTRALHILFKRRSEILDVFISLPVEGG